MRDIMDFVPPLVYVDTPPEGTDKTLVAHAPNELSIARIIRPDSPIVIAWFNKPVEKFQDPYRFLSTQRFEDVGEGNEFLVDLIHRWFRSRLGDSGMILAAVIPSSEKGRKRGNQRIPFGGFDMPPPGVTVKREARERLMRIGFELPVDRVTRHAPP